MYDDDALDRALAALPLEEPPAHLHARIMAATVHAPSLAALAAGRTAGWEIWLVGVLAAAAVWLSGIVLTTPHVTERVIDTLQNGGIASMTTMLWIAVGASTVFWISQISFPQPRRIRIR